MSQSASTPKDSLAPSRARWTETLQRTLAAITHEIPELRVILAKVLKKEGEALAMLSLQLSRAVERIAPIFKDPAFRAEREWCFVAAAGLLDGLQPGGSPFGTETSFDVLHLERRFRSDRWNLLPFVAPKLSEDGRPLPVRELVVGPGPDQATGALGVELLARQSLPSAVEIKLSKVPFRNW